MEAFDRSYVKKLRYAFQWGLFAFIVYGGAKLYFFSRHFAFGDAPLVERPPLVEGFLPIGALMGLKLWLVEGVFDPVHPAAIVIFLAALSVSAILKKSFCVWFCPVGALSEAVYKAGRKLFGKNLAMPKPIDYPLRALKYILLGFFLYIVFVAMSPEAIRAFLETPYWKIADIKMLEFFTKMSRLTFFALSALFVLSLLFKNFWCRYLCPYGALLGLLSLLSPVKVTRNADACIGCGKCKRNCPSYIPVNEKRRVWSPECTGCLTCVSGCPAKGALDASLPSGKALRPAVYAALAAVVFFGIVFAAKSTGHWRSSVTYEEYKALVPIAGQLNHP